MTRPAIYSPTDDSHGDRAHNKDASSKPQVSSGPTVALGPAELQAQLQFFKAQGAAMLSKARAAQLAARKAAQDPEAAFKSLLESLTHHPTHQNANNKHVAGDLESDTSFGGGDLISQIVLKVKGLVDVEAKRRLEIFEANLKNITLMNEAAEASGGSLVAFGTNGGLAMLSNEEVESNYLTKVPEGLGHDAKSGDSSGRYHLDGYPWMCGLREYTTPSCNDRFRSQECPAAFDWRAGRSAGGAARVPAVKQQSNCSSSGAFAAVAALESAALAGLQGQGLALPSVDDLLGCVNGGDCGPGGNSWDYLSRAVCTSGFKKTVPVARLRAPARDSGAPESRDGGGGKAGCDAADPGASAGGFAFVPEDMANVKAALLRAPLVVGVRASALPIKFYSGGIVPCSLWDQEIQSSGLDQAKVPIVDHFMTVVGYQTNVEMPDGSFIDTIIAKNSWGPSWGDKGYITLEACPDGNFGMFSYPIVMPL